MKIHSLKCLLAVVILNWIPPSLFAQGTAFTYQGALQASGTAAAGSYDLKFTLFDVRTNGTALAGPVTNAAVTVSHGLFTTLVDFGGAGSGASNWLEIAVSTNGANVFATLSPRQPITPVPSALYALAASNVLGTVSAGQLTGTVSSANLPASVVTTNAIGVALSGSFSGNGAALTNLSASNVAGILVWQRVTGTNQQAQANTGYLASNPGTVTLTLPASPSVGDVVRVSGIGGGGWIIAPNAGQSILRAVAYTNWSLLNNWTLSSAPPSEPWYAIASSADGTRLAAGVLGGGIYTSTNAGSTWTGTSAPGESWASIASSADGTKLAAGTYRGGIYISTNAGSTWTVSSAPTEYWYSIASSADGTKLAATDGHGIYTSTNAGSTWTQTSAPGELWFFIASSADGTKLAADVSNGGIYTSADSGLTWTQTSAPSEDWYSIASSSDGTKLAAVVGDGGQIYTSTDSGSTWIPTSAPGEGWSSIAASADGTELAAVANGGGIYTSTNAGSTWTATSAPGEGWSSIASSADGTKLAAVVYVGGIYTAQINNATSTTPGPAGYLTGAQNSAVELQYIGNNQWLPLSYTGTVIWY